MKLQVAPYDQTKKQNVPYEYNPWKYSGGFVSLLEEKTSKKLISLKLPYKWFVLSQIRGSIVVF